MITYYEGTIFNVNVQALVNTVNCTGVMGAGIALEFMLRYPDMYEDYVEKCKEKRIKTGKVDYFKSSDGQIIINFPTKWHFKYPSKLIWIEQGLQDFVLTYRDYEIHSVAFPKLGASKGGLVWEDVRALMERYLSPLDIDVYICLDNKKVAEGIERVMLDKFNATDIIQLSDIVKLNKKQRQYLNNSMPYSRFWQISETTSIGIKTYRAIFDHFYLLAIKETVEQKQASIQDYL